MDISGSIFAATLTPMNADGSIAPAGVAPLTDFILSKGVHGLYVSGSTGESVLQSRSERAEILSATAEHAREKCSLIAHVGSASTGDAVALAAIAGELGYNAVSAVPPYYYKHNFEDIADYYRAIADASGLPLIIYNIPALSGTDLSTARLLELMEDDRIAGVKFTAQDLFQFEELRKTAPNKKFYFGTDEMFLGAAAMGTDGGIGSTYNLIGDVYVAVEIAVAAGDIDEARRQQRKANDLIAILLKVGVVGGLKHALNRLGVPVGPCRRPFSPMSADGITLLNTWLDENGYAP
ncbi:MAG: N-acetylneuraminate lyase [Paracoccaceae bacterium]|nr:N-acetylneuraminate lyase [Paracoccaceae bacterium]MDG1738269.1 N-acetylneuraminate lyase [Paracoccaceae bacterium]MDG2258492.1 N-acetylneuraminate lyase [Paracoccaceae bacterium]